MNIPKNGALWIAVGIPLLMIILVAVGIYIPRLRVQPPDYNFLYALPSNDPYAPGYYYIVRDGKLMQEKLPEPPKDYPKSVPIGNSQIARLYLYDVASNSTKEISFEAAQKLELDGNLESPDGYDIQQGSGGGVFPFFIDGNNYNSRYLVHGSYSQKLELKGTDPNGYNNFQFLGWVLSS